MMAVAAALCAFCAYAQEDPSKETVIVDPFTNSAGASETARDNVRSAVISGFSQVGRFFVVDAMTDSRLSKLYENRKIEDVVNDANWKAESDVAPTGRRRATSHTRLSAQTSLSVVRLTSITSTRSRTATARWYTIPT